MSSPFLMRRLLGFLSLLVAVAALVVTWRHLAPTLRNLAYFTGWALMGVMLFLTLYNARKKLPFLPLGSSRLWLQLHAYVGYFSAALFLAHVSWRIPNGAFEVTLSVLYLLVAGSGVLGLFWSRHLPARLTSRGGEVLFERIPVVRRSLQDRAEALAMKSVSAGQTTVISDFYGTELSDFFRGPRHQIQHLLGGNRAMDRLRTRMEDLARFLTPEQRQHLDELGALVLQKDGLDHQHALQLSLRLWLFVHIPLTYSLLIATVLHVVLVHGFSLGAMTR